MGGKIGTNKQHNKQKRVTNMAILISQCLKNLPAIQEIQEMWIQSLRHKDPLDGEMATAPVFLTEKSHEQRRLVGYGPKGHKESDTIEQLNTWHN